MDLLTVPGVYPLGPDATLNLMAALVRRAGGRVALENNDLEFSTEDALRLAPTEASGIELRFCPKPTDEQVNAALTALGIDPATATETQRNLIKELLKAVQLGT